MPLFVVDTNRVSLFGAPLPTINPHTLAAYATQIYDGCEFGCAYCAGWGTMARPLNESVRMMPEIVRRAREELATIDRGAVIGLTEASDAYQPAEQQYRRTRAVLQVLAECAQPVTIMTKSARVLDDAELLVHIHQRSFAMVIVSVMTHVHDVSARLEDRCDSTTVRLQTVQHLKKLGIPVGVALQPLIPYLNDTDYAIRNLLTQIASAGADFVYWDYLCMPNQRHRNRIHETLIRVTNNPPMFLRELYGDQGIIDSRYRAERDQHLVWQCDSLQLPLALPYAHFAQRIDTSHTIAALLRQLAFRDRAVGRSVLALQAEAFADRIYLHERPLHELQRYAHYEVIRPALQRVGWL